MKQTMDEVINRLTLSEKLSMIHGTGIFHTGGVERLCIPPLISSDGPMGVRREFHNGEFVPKGSSEDYVTYMPSNSAIAASFDPECAKSAGRVLGEEARGRGKDVILAPGINIKRSPLCGRNFEYMSEDPCLIAELCVPLIEGIQESDVSACVKHFAVNNQETGRLAVDTYVEEQTLRELYLPGFLAAVKHAKSLSLMTAYNRFRGVFCSRSNNLMKDILREEWKYDGVLFSDWGGVHETVETAKSPLTIEMSVHGRFDEYYFANPLKKAVEDGEVPESCIDEKIRDILTLMERLHMISFGDNEQKARKKGSYNTAAHHEAVLSVAEKSMILLKNEGILPLSEAQLHHLLLVGENAGKMHALGGGSAEIKALFEESPLLGICEALGGNVQVEAVSGYRAKEQDETEEAYEKSAAKLCEEALSKAKTADAVIFVGGLNHDYDCEGQDRKDMKLPYGQEQLIDQLLSVAPNTVLCFIAGSPIEMPFADRAKAILFSYYAGMKTGTALSKILFGSVNPSGKLPESFPMKLSDSPAHQNGEWGNEEKVTYKENLMVGYRYYTTKGVKPRFAFGHGLSYTTFSAKAGELQDGNRDCGVYLSENMLLAKKRMDEDYKEGSIPANEDCSVLYTLPVTVKNTGTVAGAEVLQLYTAALDLPERPILELRQFFKVFLLPDEEKTVWFGLRVCDFAVFDSEKNQFVLPKGKLRIAVGTASDQLFFDTSVIA